MATTKELREMSRILTKYGQDLRCRAGTGAMPYAERQPGSRQALRRRQPRPCPGRARPSGRAVTLTGTADPATTIYARL